MGRILWAICKRLAVLAVVGGAFAAQPLAAQNPYSEAVSVNGLSVTYFEIGQRKKLLTLLGAPEDVTAEARQSLIEDRLREYAGKQAGQSVTPDEIKTAMTDFAKPANLSADQFVAELEAGGVYRETFEDFIRTSLIWRKVVEAKFRAKALITEAELDTAMALGTTAVGTSVLVSELILPVAPGAEDDTMQLAEMLAKRIRSFDEFEQAVLTYSASPSRVRGGKLDWMPADKLPPVVAQALPRMAVGAVTPPVRLPNAVAIFQLRGLRDNRTVAARPIAYDYATVRIPGGRSADNLARAGALAGKVDTCMDLKALAGKYGTFSRQVTPVGKTPRRIAAEIAALDANEVSTALTAGNNGEYLLFLMLCGRTNRLSEGNREQVRLALFNQRMEAFGAGYLQELKGDAMISTR